MSPTLCRVIHRRGLARARPWQGELVDPVMALRAAGGADRWAHLMSAGVSRRALANAVAAGTVARRLFGTYALPESPDMVWLAAAFHGTVSCVSLCDSFGLPLLCKSVKAHVLVPVSRGLASTDVRPARRVVLHRRPVALADLEANPIAVAIDVASLCVDRYAQLALVDAALKAGQLQRADVHGFRHTPLAQRLWLADLCDHESQSIMESYARVWLAEAGFMVQPQLVVKPRGHRDLLVEGCVVVDLDGWATHGNKVAFREDRALDRFAIHDGKVTLRYTYADLFGRDRVDLVADVEAALRLLRKGA